ncbi:hypothetical protein HQ571_00415 [Candidatus Kuenenbacteria bacterium]|nr:hypothetical protein [Candidatus Kuenenbacteria bacterium]
MAKTKVTVSGGGIIGLVIIIIVALLVWKFVASISGLIPIILAMLAGAVIWFKFIASDDEWLAKSVKWGLGAAGTIILAQWFGWWFVIIVALGYFIYKFVRK